MGNIHDMPIYPSVFAQKSTLKNSTFVIIWETIDDLKSSMQTQTILSDLSLDVINNIIVHDNLVDDDRCQQR
jgi:hypothetical protein